MELNIIKNALLSSFEGNEINELLKFSFNNSLTYLIDKYHDGELPENILSIEDRAIKVSASFFQENEKGNIELKDNLSELFKNCSTKGDFEYELLKKIHYEIDCTLKGWDNPKTNFEILLRFL